MQFIISKPFYVLLLILITIMLSCFEATTAHARYRSFIMAWVDSNDNTVFYASGDVSGTRLRPANYKQTQTLFANCSGTGQIVIQGNQARQSYTDPKRVCLIWFPFDIHRGTATYNSDPALQQSCASFLRLFSSETDQSAEQSPGFTIKDTFRMPLQRQPDIQKYRKKIADIAYKYLSPAAILILAGSGSNASLLDMPSLEEGDDQSIWGAVFDKNMTMLHLAIRYRDDDPSIPQAVLAQCGNEDNRSTLLLRRTTGKRTALHLAARYASMDSIMSIISQCPQGCAEELLRAENDYGWTALDLAARYRAQPFVRALCIFYEHYKLDYMKTRWRPSLFGPQSPAFLSIANSNPGVFSCFKKKNSGRPLITFDGDTLDLSESDHIIED